MPKRKRSSKSARSQQHTHQGEQDQEQEQVQLQVPVADVVIDGSKGEGGGQMVRIALALASIFRRSVRIDRIRFSRPKPGLQAQHACGAQLVARLCSAQLYGGHLGCLSTTLGLPSTDMTPLHIPVQCVVGTAGATSLILQAALPAAIRYLPSIQNAPSNPVLTILGGTTVPYSPTSDYVQQVLLPNLKLFGLNINYNVETHGFYPRGGGRVSVSVDKSACRQFFETPHQDELSEPRYVLRPCNIVHRGTITAIEGTILVSGSQYHQSALADVLRHEVTKVLRRFAHHRGDCPTLDDDFITIIKLAETDSVDKVLSITLYATTSSGTVLGTSIVWDERDARTIMERARKPDLQAKEESWIRSVAHTANKVADEFCSVIASGAVLDANMADQVCIFMAMSSGVSEFLVADPSHHLLSVVDVMQTFGVDISLEAADGDGNRLLRCEGLAIPFV